MTSGTVARRVVDKINFLIVTSGRRRPYVLPSIHLAKDKVRFICGAHGQQLASSHRVLRATDHVTQRMPEFMNLDRRAIKGDSHPQGAVNAARYL